MPYPIPRLSASYSYDNGPFRNLTRREGEQVLLSTGRPPTYPSPDRTHPLVESRATGLLPVSLELSLPISPHLNQLTHPSRVALVTTNTVFSRTQKKQLNKATPGGTCTTVFSLHDNRNSAITPASYIVYVSSRKVHHPAPGVLGALRAVLIGDLFVLNFLNFLSFHICEMCLKIRRRSVTMCEILQPQKFWKG